MGKSATKTHKTLVKKKKKNFRCEVSLRCSRHKFKLVFKDRQQGFPGGSEVKNTPDKAGDTALAGLIPGSGRFPWRRK